MKIRTDYEGVVTPTLGYNQDGLLTLSTGIMDTTVTGTVGTTTDSTLQQSSLKDNEMEIIQGTSILSGVVVGLVIALIANLADQRLNRNFQPDYDEEIQEERKTNTNEDIN